MLQLQAVCRLLPNIYPGNNSLLGVDTLLLVTRSMEQNETNLNVLPECVSSVWTKGFSKFHTTTTTTIRNENKQVPHCSFKCGPGFRKRRRATQNLSAVWRSSKCTLLKASTFSQWHEVIK